MKIRNRKLLFIIILLLPALALCAEGNTETSYTNSIDLAGYINDHAEVIDYDIEKILRKMIIDLERDKDVAFTIVTIDKLKDTGIKELSSDLFNRWADGETMVDYGILMLVAIKDSKIWIKAGEKIEEILTDDRIEIIIDRDISPFFTQEMYSQAIYSGLIEIDAYLREQKE